MKLTVHHLARPEIKYEVELEESIETLISKGILFIDIRDKQTKLLYRGFVVESSIDSDMTIPMTGNINTSVSDIKNVWVMINKDDEPMEITNINYNKFSLDNVSKEMLYNNYPVIAIDNDPIYTKTFDDKFFILCAVYGVLPTQVDWGSDNIPYSGDEVTLTFSNGYNSYDKTYLPFEISELLQLLVVDGDGIRMPLNPGYKLIAENGKPINEKSFIKRYV